MKRRSFLVAASSAAVVAGVSEWGRVPGRAVAAPHAPADGPPVVAVRTDLAAIAATVPGIAIDGTLSNPAWGDPQWRAFTSLYALDRIKDTALHLVHDAGTLYLGVRVAGEVAATLSHVSVLVSVDGRYHAATVQIRSGSPRPSFTWGGTATTLTTQRSAFRAAADLVTCEVAIPLSALGITGDPLGRAMGVNVVLDHLDQTGPTATSAPTRTSVNSFQGGSGAPMITDVVDEDRAASVHLGHAVPLASGRRSPQLVEPEELTVEYIDFTHKTIRVDVADATVADTVLLDWRGPGGDWTRLEAATKPARGGVAATIEHPAPAAPGQYQLRIGVLARSGDDRLILATFDRDDLINAGDLLATNRPHPGDGGTAVTPAPASEATATLINLVPERTGFTFCGVPENPALHPNATYTWSADNPDKIIAKATGTAYPHNDFPENQVITVTNRLGESVDYPYHQDAEGKRYFLSAHLWYHQRNYVYGQLVALATADPLGAARVLHRFAQVYAGWVPTNEYPWFNRPLDPSATPRNFYWGGTWYRWSIADLGAMESIGHALALVLETDAFDVLSEEVGEDVRAMVIERTIEPSVDWFRTFTRRYTNNDYPSYVGMSTLASALGDSSYAHEAVEWAREYLRRGFLFDGFWKETTLSYHSQSINGLFQVADALKGWSDADGYESPRSGQRFSNLDLLADMAVLAASQRIPNLLVYPDTKLFPMADTWAFSTAGRPELDAGSVLLGAAGVARLSRGGVSATGPFGVVHQFLELTITEQSVPVKPFPASGTVQFEAVAADQSVTFAFAVAAADSYDLDLLPFHAGSYGRYAISVDDQVVAEHDFFAAAGGVAEFVTLGRVDLSVGEHTITFRGLGKSEASTGFKMGVVSLALLDEAARTQRDSAEPPETANPSQAYLQFTPKYGHNHLDPLTLALYAEGQELLPDLGYSHTIYRRWSVSTLAHSTVTVDSSDMDTAAGRDGGSVEVFDHTDQAVQVVRAEFGTAYPQTSRYQRETWAIEHPDTNRHEGYLLDLFRVTGGERHEFTINGDANRDAEMTTPVTTVEHGPYLLPPGVTVVEPTTELETGTAEGHYYGYIYVRDVRRAPLTDGQFDVTLSTTLASGAGAHARILGVAGPDTELFLGRSPSLRATRVNGTAGDTNDEVVKWTMPKLVLRRDGNDLTSNFVTVVEPSAAGAQGRIESVELLPHNGSEDDLAVKVSHADGTVDVIISSQDPESTVTADGVTVTGKLGWARVRGGATTALRLVGGTKITAPGKELVGTGAISGALSATRRKFDSDPVDALVTTASVPEWAIGHTVVVTHPDGKTHGYPIKGVSTADGSTLIELDAVDPGFSIAGDGTSTLAFTPFTVWTGETTFRVENSATL